MRRGGAAPGNVGWVGWYAAALIVVVMLALYGSWTARRLDRLHARIDATGTGLDAQLRNRAAAAARLADSGTVSRDVVATLAPPAMAAAEATGLGHDREVLENALSRALQDVAELLPPDRPEV